MAGGWLTLAQLYEASDDDEEKSEDLRDREAVLDPGRPSHAVRIDRGEHD